MVGGGAQMAYMRDLLLETKLQEGLSMIDRFQWGDVCPKLTALITELEASPDPDEVFDTLMCPRDDVRDKHARLDALNDCITRAEEQIKIKEEHVRVMEAEANDG
ncbi:hypothetical protein Tco_1435899 [Tanacetum coccineum]